MSRRDQMSSSRQREIRKRIEQRRRLQKENKPYADEHARGKKNEHVNSRSFTAYNQMKESQSEKEIRELFIDGEQKKLFAWKRVTQNDYFQTLAQVSEIENLWRRIPSGRIKKDKFLNFCEPYVRYLPDFLEDVGAHATEGFFTKYIFLKSNVYDFLAAYSELKKYLEK